MSKAELTDFVKHCSEEDRQFLWRTLVVSFSPIDKLHADSIDQRFKEMDLGRRVFWDDVRDELIAREAEPDEDER